MQRRCRGRDEALKGESEARERDSGRRRSKNDREVEPGREDFGRGCCSGECAATVASLWTRALGSSRLALSRRGL